VSDGRVSLVLHTHMPYVEGFGTWPFGEEWLWEAVATSYLPILDLLDAGAPLTLSLTPVVCDQLADRAALDRCAAFLRDVRPASHQLDIDAFREVGATAEAQELERAAGQYADALTQLEAATSGGDGLLARLAPHAAWTSSATHAILPLLATDAGVRLQVQTGVESHRARFGDGWRGGFWLPECAHEPWVDVFLEEAGVHAACVELTEAFGAGDVRHLTPLRSAAGPLLVPIDRALIDLVWGPGGYPSHDAYRDEHHRTTRDHRPWANDGSVYDPERGLAQARADARAFAELCAERVRDGGLCTLAFDTELFGHHWHEGPAFLAAFVQACADRQLPLVPLDDALADVQTAPWPDGLDAATSWGQPPTLWTWSGPQVADMARAQRDGELRVVARGSAVPERAVRELLALQASDWPFLETRALAGPYARERFAGHLGALDQALDAVPSPDPAVRNLAPMLRTAPLLEP
jgi:1,4-alpha-glucan branching enzyme